MIFFLSFQSTILLFVILFLIVLNSGALKNLLLLKFIFGSIFIFSVVVWSITMPNGTSFYGPFSIEGIKYGLLSGIRLVSLMIIGVLLISTSKIEDLSMGLIKLGLPYKFVFSFTTTLRFMPMIMQTAIEVKNAQTLRGVNINTKNPVKRIINHIPMLIPIFAKTIKRTNDLALALEVKCFGLYKKRSFYNKLSFGFKDILFLIITSLIITVLTI